MCHTYILYSPVRNKYYVGATCDQLEERIRKHNTNHSGFTGKTKDWMLVYQEQFESYELALQQEKQLKKERSSILYTHSNG
jgi:putative endonuclease